MTVHLEAFESMAGFRLQGRSFAEIDPQREVRRIRRLIEALRTVVEPLELVACIAVADESRFIASSVKRARRGTFILRASDALVPPTAAGIDPVLEQVPAIEPQTVEAWLYGALSQETLPNNLFLSALAMYSARVRMASDELVEQATLLVRDDSSHCEIAVPVERRGTGAWVSGPGRGIDTAPVRFLYNWDAGSAHVTVDVHWSAWRTPGTAEHELLCTCARKLYGSDWRLSISGEPSDSFAALEDVATEPDPEEANRWKRAGK